MLICAVEKQYIFRTKYSICVHSTIIIITLQKRRCSFYKRLNHKANFTDFNTFYPSENVLTRMQYISILHSFQPCLVKGKTGVEI